MIEWHALTHPPRPSLSRGHQPPPSYQEQEYYDEHGCDSMDEFEGEFEGDSRDEYHADSMDEYDGDAREEYDGGYHGDSSDESDD